MNRLLTDLRDSWRHPKQRLSLTDAKITDHLEVMHEFVGDAANKEMNDWIVANLDTLDRKAQGLLLLNAVVLTIATLLYPRIDNDLGLVGLVAIVITMAVLICDCIMLAILNVAYWSSTLEFKQPKDLFKHLLELREQRTRIIWLACMLGVFCLISILVLVIFDAITLAG